LYAGYTFENFIEGDCNFTACEACKSVAEKPGDPALNPLFVYGKSGLGKTHLLQSIAGQMLKGNSQIRVVYCHAYEFLRDATAMSKALDAKLGNVRELAYAFQEKYENCDVLLLDDVQLLEYGVSTQKRLAILIKHLRAQGKQVVLSCDRHPSQFNPLREGEARPKGHSEIPCISEKLLAPLESCVAVGLDVPDLTTRMKLIQKKSMSIPFVDKDREEICRFLSLPPRENFRVIEGMLNGLRAMNEFCEENLDLGAVKRLVAAPGTSGVEDLSVKGISETVAMEFGCELTALASKRQDAGVALPRKVAMYLCREMTSTSLVNIGEFFNRDYSSVIAAIRSLVKQMDKDEDLARKVKDIRYLLEA
jgi:chromosomal replication initiator protein